MNPRLIKFAVELQNAEKHDEGTKKINFLRSGFNVLGEKPARVTVHVEKDE